MKKRTLMKRVLALSMAIAALASTISVSAAEPKLSAEITSDNKLCISETVKTAPSVLSDNVESATVSAPSILSTNIITGANARASQYPSIFSNNSEFNMLYYTNVLRHAAGSQPLSSTSSMQYCADIRTAEIARTFSSYRPTGTNFDTVLSDTGIEFVDSGEVFGRVYEDAFEFIQAIAETSIEDPESPLSTLVYDGFSHVGTGANMHDNYPYYELLFSGDCTASSLGIWNYQPVFYAPAGTVLDDLYIVFLSNCAHGTSYFPLIEDYLVNYNPNLYNVVQDVTMNFHGASHTFKVMLYDMTNFTDVPYTKWYYPAVSYVYKNNLMSGLTNTVFGPSQPVTRAQFATIIQRMNGYTPAVPQGFFSDVPSGKWYSDAVYWAYSTGVITGLTPTTFGPNQNITREQMAVMMYRYAKYLGIDTSARANIYTFADAHTTGSYATEAISWAIAEGLITGMNASTLAPKNTASRAECAAIIQRFYSNLMYN